jgi:hypothetical protein
MTKQLFVRPSPGRRLKHPAAGGFRVVPDAGEIVPDTSYWRRRLRAGDAIEGQTPPEAPKKAKEK